MGSEMCIRDSFNGCWRSKSLEGSGRERPHKCTCLGALASMYSISVFVDLARDSKCMPRVCGGRNLIEVHVCPFALFHKNTERHMAEGQGLVCESVNLVARVMPACQHRQCRRHLTKDSTAHTALGSTRTVRSRPSCCYAAGNVV